MYHSFRKEFCELTLNYTSRAYVQQSTVCSDREWSVFLILYRNCVVAKFRMNVLWFEHRLVNEYKLYQYETPFNKYSAGLFLLCTCDSLKSVQEQSSKQQPMKYKNLLYIYINK